MTPPTEPATNAAPEAPMPPAPADLPEPKVHLRRRWLPSLIWLIPIVAALVGVTLVAKLLLDRGPEIEITFKTADGLEAGKTAVKYKDVQIGTVQDIRLSKDHMHVRVTVQLRKDADGFVAQDTRFWVVRPRLDTSGISGLGTLLSGAYIGADIGTSEETADAFEGLETPPIVTRDASGRQFLLHATDVGSLDIGSPVFYRRIKVGQVAAYDLDKDGRGVTLRVFVNAPYDQFVGSNTRFWQASGIDLQVGAQGVALHTQSLATIVLGGLAFRAPDDQIGAVAPENSEFKLAEDESTAMRDPDGPSRSLLLYFNQSLRGLAVGAPVDFRGVVIGEVKSIGAEFDRDNREFRMPVWVDIYPQRLRRRSATLEEVTPEVAVRRLQFLIDRGLRAQLRNGNLLTGQIYVALDFFPKAPKVQLDVSQNPIELPTMPNSLDEIQAQVQDIVSKVNKMPIEQIGKDVRTALVTLNKTLVTVEKLGDNLNQNVAPEVTAAVKDARKTLDSANKTIASDSPLQSDLRQTLQELTRSAASLRALTDYLERHPESLLRGKPEEKK